MRPNDDSLGLSELLAAIVQHRVLFCSIVLLCAMLAVAIALIMRPVYRAETLLISAENPSGVAGLGGLASQYSGLASLVGIDISTEDAIKSEAIATFRSRSFIEGFIRDRDLVKVLFADDWDDASGEWDIEDPADIPTEADAAKVFTRGILDVSEDRQTGLVTLSIEWYDRAQAADWANDLVSRLNLRMRQRAIAEAESSIEFLQKELGRTEFVNLTQSLYGLLEGQVSKVMLANVREQYAFRIIEPALIPTLRDKVRPKRALIAITGFLGGIVMGLVVVVLVHAAEPIRRST